MIDKFKLHGEDFVKYLDGGSALHMNIAEHLSKDQYRQLLNVAAHYGTNYFTFNCRNTVCNNCGFISKDTLEKCPKCGAILVKKVQKKMPKIACSNKDCKYIRDAEVENND